MRASQDLRALVKVEFVFLDVVQRVVSAYEGVVSWVSCSFRQVERSFVRQHCSLFSIFLVFVYEAQLLSLSLSDVFQPVNSIGLFKRIALFEAQDG